MSRVPTEIPRRQLDALKALAAFQRERGYNASMREIGEKLKIGSTNWVSELIRGLKARGLVESDPGKARTARLTAAGWEALSAGVE